MDYLAIALGAQAEAKAGGGGGGGTGFETFDGSLGSSGYIDFGTVEKKNYYLSHPIPFIADDALVIAQSTDSIIFFRYSQMFRLVVSSVENAKIYLGAPTGVSWSEGAWATIPTPGTDDNGKILAVGIDGEPQWIVGNNAVKANFSAMDDQFALLEAAMVTGAGTYEDAFFTQTIPWEDAFDSFSDSLVSFGYIPGAACTIVVGNRNITLTHYNATAKVLGYYYVHYSNGYYYRIEIVVADQELILNARVLNGVPK